MNEEDYLSLRFLNDLLFCERRASLHMNEQIWNDNQYTTEGLFAHKRVDVAAIHRRGMKHNVTAMWLISHRLKLIGKSDLIEFVPDTGGTLIPFPVDFKRGKKRRWDNNEAQLCAQAICLEEMMGVSIPRGAIFHIKSQTREVVEFNADLRITTEAAAIRLHKLIASGETPLAKFHLKCRGCSLLEICMPKALRPKATATRYLESIIHDTLPSPEIADNL